MRISLGNYSLGKESLGRVSLGRIGGEMLSQGTSGGPLYKRILNSMPSALRESLRAWHSPNLQGLTNAELQDSNKKLVKGLKDLSENGNDMDLHGFLGVDGEGHIDEDGNLCFDGTDDYGNATTEQLKNNDYTIFFDQKTLSKNTKWVIDWRTLDNQNSCQLVCNYNNAFCENRKQWETINQKTEERFIIVSNSEKCNQYSGKWTQVYNMNKITLGRHYKNEGYNWNGILYSLILFSRTLNDEEIAWVKSNMLVSQSVKTNTITLYCGEFDEDGTLIDEDIDVFTFSVQHGNSLNDADGNLLSKYHKDIDSTHCTSDTWYDTDGLEYAGEAITEDTTFYCERQKISDYMLEQLDGVTLSDGSTAKEHLVCWYQPKLQGLTKESVLADKVLADLSGNGYDMTLYGFTEDEDIINSDGSLHFDGEDDGGICSNQLSELSDICLIYDMELNYAGNDSKAMCLYKANSLDFYVKGHSGNFRLFDTYNQYPYGRLTFPINSIIVNSFSLYINNKLQKDNIEFIKPISGNFEISNINGMTERGTLINTKSIIIFDQTLTTDQLTAAKNILLRNTPAVKLYTVTFMSRGAVAKVVTVGKESNIWELPVYDYADNKSTGKWHVGSVTGAEFTRNTYVTDNLTLVAEEIATYQAMMLQLENVTLSDGATAKSHLVCMYNPKLQGLDKKSVVENKTLLDLSGNEIDMELSGFETDIEPINADGSIVFDGVDDYGMSPTVPHQAKTIIIVGKTTDSAVSAGFLFGKGEDDGSYQDTELGVRLGNENVGTWAMFSTSASKAYSGGVPFSNIKRVVVVTRNRLNVDGTDILTRSAEYNQLFAPIRISGHRGNIKGAVIWSAIIFDSDLTDSDLTTVKSILLRDTPYLPASHTVTLRYAGKTEPLKTLTVLHNSNVTSFETYELDDTHVSDKWYVDAGLRQEYTGGWITGDCTLWCSSKEMYKYMLEQLDALELSDGSTAKEHLVAWYQPKLQGLTKESVLADKVLADLSGNGYDMTLYGFTEDEDIINSDGSLHFDGVDDIGISSVININGKENVCILTQVSDTETRCGYVYSWRNNKINAELSLQPNTTIVRYCGAQNPSATKYIGKRVYICNGGEFTCDEQLLATLTPTTELTDMAMYIARQKSSTIYANMILYNIVIFDQTLTTDQLTQIKQILKLS